MSFNRHGTRARDVFAAIRAETPGIASAEKELGSRLTIARNVMRLRIQRGYTQRQLAQHMGVRQPRIAEIESARANLQVDTLDRLAQVFGVETATLFRAERSRIRTAVAVRAVKVQGAKAPSWESPRRAYAHATFGNMEKE